GGNAMELCANLVASLVAAASAGFTQTAPTLEAKHPAIGVLIYDNASVSAGALYRTSERVKRIYRAANIDVHWIDPRLDRRLVMTNPTSNLTRMFVIQIVIRQHYLSRPTSAAESVMGTALEGGPNGGTAFVFYDQVLRMARH